MILASAIKIKSIKTGEELILCGIRHCDCFMQLKQLGLEAKKDYEEIEQGFITNDNRFLNRKEAIAHAVVIGQANAHTCSKYRAKKKTSLFSEDLW